MRKQFHVGDKIICTKNSDIPIYVDEGVGEGGQEEPVDALKVTMMASDGKYEEVDMILMLYTTGAAPSSRWSKYLDSDEYGLSSMPPATPPPLPRSGSSVSSAANQVKYTYILKTKQRWDGRALAATSIW